MGEVLLLLLLFLVLFHRGFLVGQELARVVEAGVNRIGGILQDEAVIGGFRGLAAGAGTLLLERSQLELKLGVGLDDGLQRLAQVGAAVHVVIDVVANLVDKLGEIFQQIVNAGTA